MTVTRSGDGLALYDRSDRSRCARAEPRGQPVRAVGRHAGVPAIAHAVSGAIVSNLSLMAMAPLPLTSSDAISKAAAFNLSQSLRALLAARGVGVHGVLTGPTDTDMTRGFDIPKASAVSVAGAILDGVERGEEDIFPDPMSQTVAEGWRAALPRRSSARTRRS